jgi:hypothetical protein
VCVHVRVCCVRLCLCTCVPVYVCVCVCVCVYAYVCAHTRACACIRVCDVLCLCLHGKRVQLMILLCTSEGDLKIRKLAFLSKDCAVWFLHKGQLRPVSDCVIKVQTDSKFATTCALFTASRHSRHY